MAREYTRDATEHGQFLIAKAILGLSQPNSSEEIALKKEFDRDATEYGQKIIADAIKELSSVISGGGSTPSGDITDLLRITVNVTQSEHQLIYWNFNNYDEFGMVASDIDISDPTQYSSQYGNLVSSVVKCGQIFSIGILPDNGYNRGDFTISIDGELLVEGQDYQVEGNEVHGLEVPLGSTINISATPATVSEPEPSPSEPEPSPIEHNITLKISVADQNGNSIDCNGCDAEINIYSEGYHDATTFDSNGEATFTISEYYAGTYVDYNAESIASSGVFDNYVDVGNNVEGQYTLTDDDEQTINIVLTAVSAMSPKSVKISVTDQHGNIIDCNNSHFEVQSDDGEYTESGNLDSSGEATISVPYICFKNETSLNCTIDSYNSNLYDNYMPYVNGNLNDYDANFSEWRYYHLYNDDYFNDRNVTLDITFTNETQRIYMNAVDEDTGETLLADYDVSDNYASSSSVNVGTENGLHYFDGLVGREYEININIGNNYPSGTYLNDDWTSTRSVDGSNTQQEIAEFEQENLSTSIRFVDGNNNSVQGSYSYYTKNSINVQSSTVSGTGEEVDISHKSRDTIHFEVDASGFQHFEAEWDSSDSEFGESFDLTLDEVV